MTGPLPGAGASIRLVECSMARGTRPESAEPAGDDEAAELRLRYPHLMHTQDGVRVRAYILRRGTLRPDVSTGSTIADLILMLGQGVTHLIYGPDQQTVLLEADGLARVKRRYSTYPEALRDGPALEASIATQPAARFGFRLTPLRRLRRATIKGHNQR